MNDPKTLRRRQKSGVFVALLMFNLLLIMVQIWLFVSVLENLQAGHTRMAIPGAVTSLVILAVNIWMLRGISRMESSN